MKATITDLNALPVALTVRQVSEVLGIGKNAGYELVHSGMVAHVRFGRQIRVPRSEVERLLDGAGRDGGD